MNFNDENHSFRKSLVNNYNDNLYEKKKSCDFYDSSIGWS